MAKQSCSSLSGVARFRAIMREMTHPPALPGMSNGRYACASADAPGAQQPSPGTSDFNRTGGTLASVNPKSVLDGPCLSGRGCLHLLEERRYSEIAVCSRFARELLIHCSLSPLFFQCASEVVGIVCNQAGDFGFFSEVLRPVGICSDLEQLGEIPILIHTGACSKPQILDMSECFPLHRGIQISLRSRAHCHFRDQWCTWSCRSFWAIDRNTYICVKGRNRMVVKAGINGFGRIGRCLLRTCLGREDIDFVAVNDLTDARTLAPVLKYDSLFGMLKEDVRFESNAIIDRGRCLNQSARWESRENRGLVRQ